jgi:hypothetical protein
MMIKKHAKGRERKRVTRILSEPIVTENIVYLASNVIIDAGTPKAAALVAKCFETHKQKEE